MSEPVSIRRVGVVENAGKASGGGGIRTLKPLRAPVFEMDPTAFAGVPLNPARPASVYMRWACACGRSSCSVTCVARSRLRPQQFSQQWSGWPSRPDRPRSGRLARSSGPVRLRAPGEIRARPAPRSSRRRGRPPARARRPRQLIPPGRRGTARLGGSEPEHSSAHETGELSPARTHRCAYQSKDPQPPSSGAQGSPPPHRGGREPHAIRPPFVVDRA